MATSVTWQKLRELSAFRAERGCAISLYVDLDPSVAPTAGDAQTRMNSLLAEGERSREASRGDLGHDEKLGLKADFERIAAYFDDEFDRDGARGLAVFAAGLDNYWSALPLPDAVPDAVKVGRQFHLAPLVPLVGGADGTIVAVVGREQGRVYRLQAGRLVEVLDQTDDAPGQHQQGGWSQARYQRHIDKIVEEHLKSVADELDKRTRRGGAPRIVLVSGEETRAGFVETLSNEAKNALVGWTNAEAHAGPAELLEAVTPVLEQALAEDETETVDRWREEAGKDGRATSGWAKTLEAASDGRVETLLFQEGAGRGAFECPACGRATMDDGNCPLDGTRMEPRDDGLDLAVHHTLAHGGTVAAIRRRQDLDPVEGIGALLRY